MSKELVNSFIYKEGDFFTPDTTLVVATHPDDAEIYTGGLVAVLTHQGKTVHYLICSNGNTGTWDEMLSQQELTDIRIQEQLQAARILNVTEVEFLNIDDGYARVHDQYIKKYIARKIRQIKPDLVVTHDPWKKYDFHDDHRVVGQATAHAVLLASNQLFESDQLDENNGLSSHFTPLVAFFNTDTPNFWVDIEQYYSLKEQAVCSHISQFGSRKSFTINLRQEALSIGSQIDILYAESFHLIHNT